MKPKVYVTYKIPEKPLEKLKEKYDLIINDSGRMLTRDELFKNLKDIDAVICMFCDRFDKELIDHVSGIKIIANYAVGYNNIDFKYAASKNIVVTNTPDVLTNATADLALGLLFSVARRIVDSDQYTRAGKFKGWTPTLFLGQEITGKTLGIIGAGRIGSAFAKKTRGLDMNIIYFNRKPNREFEDKTGAKYVDKDTLLRESDFVSLHVPLTEETKHMLGIKEFKMMKRNAVLINTSRGAVIDENALVEALKNGDIWGAGLDVYENEPEIHPELFKLQNVILASHIGSSTTETREKMTEVCVNNILAVLEGREPLNRVN